PVAPPRYLAPTGGGTDELWAAMDEAEPLGQWDFVSLLIGVNNQYRRRPVDTYVPEFARLLARAIALARRRAERVLVLSNPDWGATPVGRDSGRDRRRIARELAADNSAAAPRRAGPRQPF